MDEFSLPALAEPPTSRGLAEMVFENAAEEPNSVAFGRKVDDGWQNVTARQFADEVLAVAKGLIALGVGVGDRVAIFAPTRYEWTLLDYSIWAAGGVTVPIYATSSAEQTEWILRDSGAVACAVDDDQLGQVVTGLRGSLPAFQHLWKFDGGAIKQLTEAGREVPDDAVEQRRAAVQPHDPATLIYTSGTTGRPKGCVLTHANFFAEVDNAVGMLKPIFLEAEPGTEPATLLFLPLAHVFGRMVQVGCVRARAKLGHTADVKNVLTDLQAFKPTFILSVPQVFEKVYNGARQKAAADGKGKIFEAAAQTAIAYSEALDAGGAGAALKAKHWVFDKLVYGKLRAAMGGQNRYAISGGAALGARLSHFFRGIGLRIFEGYGLTETTAAVTVNSPDSIRLGTVGRPLPGTVIKIAEDGEILVRGGEVFGGYWNNPDASASAFQDGWFATGDLGSLDDDGYLRITGRKKEILVTAGGKNVAPNVIEDRVRAHPLVSQCLVVGDARPFIAALITVDPEAFPLWKAEHGKPEGASVADLLDDPDLNAAVQEAVDTGNAAVSRAESVRKFRILPDDFSIESGHITPSLKLRRAQISKDYAGNIEALYVR